MPASGLWYALAGAALFGVSGVVAADAFDAIDPVAVAQARSVLAAFILGAIACRRRATDTRGRLPLLGFFGALIAAVTVTYYWAIDRLGVGPGVTIQFLGPVLVLGWMRTVQRRPVPWQAWAAAGLAVSGTALMTQAWRAAELDLLGVAAGFGAAITFAGYLIVGERLGAALPSLTVTAYGFAISGLIWVIAVPPVIPDVGPTVWVQIVWIGTLGTAVPFLLEMAALRRTDPGRVGIVATAEPVIAAVTAWIALGQVLTLPQVVGGMFTVAGVAAIQAITSSVAPDVPPASV